MVMVLTITITVGFIIIVVLFILKFGSIGKVDRVQLPERIILPSGTVPEAFTVGRSWYAVITEDDEILIFDKTTDEILKTIAIAE